MTSSVRQFEQSDRNPTPVSSLSPLQSEYFNQGPTTRETTAQEPTSLMISDVWASLKTPNTDTCPSLPIPKTLEQQHPIEQKPPSNPLETKFLSGPPDDPTFQTVDKLRFGNTNLALDFLSDDEEKRVYNHAQEGFDRGRMQEDQYLSLWANKIDVPLLYSSGSEDPTNFTYTNEDKSSFTVKDGRISEFRTAPGIHGPGVFFSDIKYDANGLVQSYSNGGQTYSREGLPSEDGMSMWRRTDNKTGQFEIYDKRNVVIDTNGIHTYLGKDGEAGTIISRMMDGSQVVSEPVYDRQRPSNRPVGLLTTTTLPDETKVQQLGYFRPHRTFKHDHAVQVKEPGGKTYLNVHVDENH